MIGMDEILAGLIQRTDEGKLPWSRTVEDGNFTTSVGAISVVIYKSASPFFPGHGFDVLDENGETVESLGPQDADSVQAAKLERLFILARRSALKIDTVLEKLAKGLEL